MASRVAAPMDGSIFRLHSRIKRKENQGTSARQEDITKV
jgi:hypothetical protein